MILETKLLYALYALFSLNIPIMQNKVVQMLFSLWSYNPYDGPNEHPEAELPLVAGKYLYVYGTMDEDGFYEGTSCFMTW